MKSIVSLKGILFVLFLTLFLLTSANGAQQTVPDISKAEKVDIQKKQLSKGAIVKDPKSHSSEGPCLGVDLAVTRVELKDTSFGIFARATVKNVCSRNVSEALVTFTGSGEIGVSQGIGPIPKGAVRQTSWIGVSVNQERRPIVVSGIVTARGDRKSSNDTKSGRLN